MSFAAHGKWCGPGWSAGKWKDAKDLTEEDKLVPAEDALDQACKNHDIAIAEGDPNANPNFYEEAAAAGWFGKVAATAVAIGGPPSHSYLRGEKKMPSKKKITREEKKAIRNRRSTKQNQLAKANKAIQISDATTTDQAMENVNKRKASQELDDDDNRERVPIDISNTDDEEKFETVEERDEFPVENPDDAIHATIDEELNQMIESDVMPNGDTFTTPAKRPTPVMQMTRTEGQPLRGARPNGIGSLTNLLNQEDNTMEDTEMAPMMMRSADASASGNPAKQKSVAVRYDSRQEMGFLTETRTAMLPLSIYFSVNKLDSDTPVKFQFILNDTYDIFRKVTLQAQTFPAAASAYSTRSWGTQGDVTTQGTLNSGTGTVEAKTPGAGVINAMTMSSRGINSADAYNLFSTYNASTYAAVARSKGISPDMAYSVSAPSAHGMKILKPVGVNAGAAVKFPVTMKSTTVGSATLTSSGVPGYASSPGGVAANGDYAMAWRNWYERMYRNRHVMKTEWRLTMENAQEGAYHRGVVLEAIDTITSDANSSNYVTPTTRSLGEMLRYKRIKENRLASFNAQGGKSVNVISGTWTPNSNRRRDVVDEELITTWYPTQNKNGPAGKNWEEIQTLLFYNDQMSNNQSGYFNCKLDLLYHVQYRDLFGAYRYPEYGDSSTILSVRDMTYPTGHPAQWPTADEPTLNEAVEIASSWNNAHV